MSNDPAKKLTINDPVDPETLQKLEGVRDARQRIADQLLQLEEEKVRLLVAARPLRDEQHRIFEKILIDRGLPPTFAIDVDLGSGKLYPLAPPPKEK